MAAQQIPEPRDKGFQRRARGEIGPIEFVKIRAYAAWKIGRTLYAFARHDASQFERAGAGVRLAPDAAFIRETVSGNNNVRCQTASTNRLIVSMGRCSPIPWIMTTACLAGLAAAFNAAGNSASTSGLSPIIHLAQINKLSLSNWTNADQPQAGGWLTIAVNRRQFSAKSPARHARAGCQGRGRAPEFAAIPE